MTALEYLARRLCWLEFDGMGPRPPEGEGRYWKKLPPETHERYLRDARYWASVTDRLAKDTASWDILIEAQREVRK